MTALANTSTADLQAMRKRLEKQLSSADGIAKTFTRKGDTHGAKDWTNRVGDLRAELAQADHELTQRGVVLGGWLDKRDLPWVAVVVLCFVVMGAAEVVG